MKTFEVSAKTIAVLEKAFRSHPISQDQTERMAAVKEKLLQIGRYLCNLTPDCDEQRKIIACLQEASFWAGEAISKEG